MKSRRFRQILLIILYKKTKEWELKFEDCNNFILFVALLE